MTDDAVFCIGCGANNTSASGTTTVSSAENGNPVIPEQPNIGGAYYQPTAQGTPSGSYNQPSTQGQPIPYSPPTIQGTPDVPYTPPSAQGTPSTPYYQPGAQATPSAPYYQNGPYNSGPNYPGGGPGKNNKTAVIIVSVIVGLCLIGGGIFAYSKLTDKDDNTTSLSDNSNAVPTVKPSIDIIVSPSPSEEVIIEDPAITYGSSSDVFAIFDAVTQDNIIAACEEIGMDISLIENMDYYDYWYDGDVYTFTYDGSVIDLFLYDDGTVYSVETGGVQVYITGYESYYIYDYMGYSTHYDESFPDNGYFFYLNGGRADSTVTFEMSDDLDYVVELINQSDYSIVTAFYLYAGTSIDMDVPEGDYIILYAAGYNWLGVTDLFGEDTVYYQSDSIYSFYPDNDSTITLDIFGGYGIASTEISADEF